MNRPSNRPAWRRVPHRAATGRASAAGASLCAALALAPAPALADPLAFLVQVSGTAQVVEVINAVGPVLRFQTQASTATGPGTFGITGYTSTDVVDLATGQGSGSNRFIASNGDELFGQFTVQALPGATPGALVLSGLTQFTGGTGLFAGASGSASFTGNGQFISQTHALANLAHSGSLALVPEPGTLGLMAGGLAVGAAALRRRRGEAGPAG